MDLVDVVVVVGLDGFIVVCIEFEIGVLEFLNELCIEFKSG